MGRRAQRILGGSAARTPARGAARRVGIAATLGALVVAALTAVGAAGAPAGVSARAAGRSASASNVVVTPPAAASVGWAVAGRVGGAPAAWIEQRPGVTLMRFDQRLVHLTLHAGSSDGGVVGWTYGDQISAAEVHHVLAAFNGAFKLTYSNVGFVSGGHVAVALKAGLASLVTYTDGSSNIGAWGNGVPSAAKRVFSVLQNQRLLIDRGVPASNLASCVILCWGGTIQNLTSVARSGLGITASGQLVWAAGEQFSPSDLASALVGAGVVRAIELDINPAWVAGYLYVHDPSGPVAVPVVPGQRGIAGQLLAPYSRDFIAVIGN